MLGSTFPNTHFLNALAAGSLKKYRRNILHVSARQHVRSHAAGPNDPASYHQFATIMFVCGHLRHNAQSIIGHINLDIIEEEEGFYKFLPLKKKKKDFTSFCQLTQPIACGRASATLPNVIHLCQTKCQRPPDRDALSTPYACTRLLIHTIQTQTIRGMENGAPGPYRGPPRRRLAMAPGSGLETTALQTLPADHSRATRIAPTPNGARRISGCARTADLCVQLCVSGPELVWLDRVQHCGVSSGVAGRNRNLLAQLGQRTRVLNRLCLSGRLQLLALSSVQLSCSSHCLCCCAWGTCYQLCC